MRLLTIQKYRLLLLILFGFYCFEYPFYAVPSFVISIKYYELFLTMDAIVNFAKLKYFILPMNTMNAKEI